MYDMSDFVIQKKPWLRVWQYALWATLFGLAIWSYGFNNVPFIRPVPLVDVLVVLVVALSFPSWWRLQRQSAIVRRLLFLMGALTLIVAFRLVLDVPRFGILAGRDALFAVEIWMIFPAMVLGYLQGRKKINQHFLWLFVIVTIWFLLYPFRNELTAISPVVGVQRPVPLFAFTTAGFLAVPMFFWFLWQQWFSLAVLGAGACVVILLFVQGRGAYLSFFFSGLAMLILHLRLWNPRRSSLLFRLLLAGVVASVMLFLYKYIPKSFMAPVGQAELVGRLGQPVGLGTVGQQLQTLVGKEGPGAGSFRHRLHAWPKVVEQVLAEPLGPIVGIGLGPDLFQGFKVAGDVLVRKPHNDFLEIWARTGLLGFLPWFGLLVMIGMAAFEGARKRPEDMWILALQITLWITSFAQPAFGFAYITVVWATLTGIWLGVYLYEHSAAFHRTSHAD